MNHLSIVCILAITAKYAIPRFLAVFQSKPKSKNVETSDASTMTEDEIIEDAEVISESPLPKRAPNAYIVFIKAKMAELRLSEPGLLSKEYMSRAAALYRNAKK